MFDLNHILVISLAVLAFFSFCFFIIVVPIALQLSRTLNSAQHLLDTINDDLEPTINEIKESISGVKTVVQKSTTKVKSGIHNANVLIMSSVHGILAGVKEYFSSYKSNETGYNNKSKG